MIEIGLKHTSELTVTDAVTAIKMGSGDMPVLATPAMMALMENAAMLAVANELPEGSTTVGGYIESSHLKPSKIGDAVVHFPYLYVQNSFSPVSSISPWHFGQVCLSQTLMLSLPHCKHNRPTSLLYDGATSAIMPPTTIFWMVWQSGHVMAVISCLKSPRPSYTSAS